MREALRAEFGRALRPPYETPAVVVMNGLLMTGAWLLLPRSWFFDFTGTMAFPIILAGWMYADVPATNVFGPDSRRILAAFDDGRELRLLLFAKNAVLWLFVTPLCIAIAFGLGVAEHQAIVTALSIVVMLRVTREADPLAREDLAFALSVVLLGLLMMVTRRNAVSQVVGFMSLENGLVLAATGAKGMPLVVEISIAFSILIAFIVIGIFLFRIRERFDTVDLQALDRFRGELQ